MVQLPPGLVEARFLVRLNRFAALAALDGGEVPVHVANSGRLRELLQRGVRVLLAPRPGAARRTPYDLALVDLDGTLVSADARLPSTLVAEALAAGRLPPLAGYPTVRREVALGESRLDLALEGPTGRCYVEVKSVTLVQDGYGLFPDAPTLRGQRHVAELARAVAAGHRAAVVFVVQRGDAAAFRPHDAADPAFGAALRRAAAAGVEVYAYRCAVTLRAVVLADPLPVCLEAGARAPS